MEGNCNCKVFCKQQVQYLKEFVNSQHHLSKQNTGTSSKDLKRNEILKIDIDELCKLED